ncbi:MAG: PaaI family thioesterase [Actinomycetia bacterium]|nr:PaaI family thioesterase [Actinomycetes bacterium]MCP4962010.1 PaaI family thioesterase [Actinomycetes bacterium]
MAVPSTEEVNALVAETYPAIYAEGMRCVEIAEGMAVARWPFDESKLRPGGLIAGPTQFAVADVALWYLAFSVIGLEPMAVTSNISIDFLRPATGSDLLGRATLLRAGRTRMTGRVDLWIDGSPERPVAHATGGYALLSPR